MEQISNTELKNFFSGIVADPSQVDAVHIQQLKVLVDLYPQSGIIRSLLARASQTHDQGGFQQRLKSAAVYAPDRSVLYNLINYPEKLTKPEKYIEDEPLTFTEEQGFDYAQDEEPYTYDATAISEEEVSANYTEEPIYEEEPVNFFHESEVAPEYLQEDIETYHTNTEEEPLPPALQNTGYYTYDNTPAIEEEEIGYNYNNVQTDQEEMPAPVMTDYNYNTVQVEQEEMSVPAMADYNYNTIEPPAEEIIQPVTAYSYDTADDYQTEQAKPYVYEEEEVEAYVYQEEEQALPYIYQPEPEEEPSAGNSDYNVGPYPEKLPPPPAPLYTFNPDNYQPEIVTPPVAANTSSEIDDEVFDEIVGIENIKIEPSHVSVVQLPETVIPETEKIPENTKPYNFSSNSFKNRMSVADDDVAEDDSVEFEMVKDEPAPKPMMRTVTQREPVKQQHNIEENEGVSKYDDDKMPYSFLWWLEKTRKEHADTYQPYVAFKPVTSEAPRPAAAADELQKQYVENIFHLTSVEQLDIHTRDKRKESEIIDRFIQLDPQMRSPNTDKLDNENKAKNSSEDKDELVSETLAKIYLDQMLYNKAIATYQKLLLKFPEKSSYFVAQIKLLEKKIN